MPVHHAICSNGLFLAPHLHYTHNHPLCRVNDRIDDDDTLRNRLHGAGVRYRTSPIKAGEAYLVPSGCLHEFMNAVPCLGVAWNIMPHPANCDVATAMATATISEVVEEIGVNTDRSSSAIEHAPAKGLQERRVAWIIRTCLRRRDALRRRRKSADAAGAGAGGPVVGESPSAEARKLASWVSLVATELGLMAEV